MVLSKDIYSPQNFLEVITGKCFIIDGEDDIDLIHSILIQEKYEDDDCCTVWDYPLDEIDEALENDRDVVLVDCMVVNPKTDRFEHLYRWFEVPDGCEGKFKEE